MQKCKEIFFVPSTPPSIQVLETQKTDIVEQGLREIREGIEANNDDETFSHNGEREENEESRKRGWSVMTLSNVPPSKNPILFLI